MKGIAMRYRAITALIVFALLIFTSCSGEAVGTTGKTAETALTETTEKTDEPDTDMINIIGSEGSRYAVIYASEHGSEEILGARDIAAEIKIISKKSLFAVSDEKTPDESGEALEILVGLTDRPESEKAYALLGENEASMSVDGNKIVIVGTDPRAVGCVIKVFIKDYIKGNNCMVPENLSRKFVCSEDIAYKKITEPIYSTGNDPWVIRHGDDYYYCWSSGGVCVRKISNLDDIKATGGSRVWSPPSGTTYSGEIWAPELHYINNQWYIYVAADDGQNKNHRMFVLRGTSQDPTEPFEFIGKISSPDNHWAIDGTVMQLHGQLYFIWSGWEGDTDSGQNIYIAHMSDPATIDSERVCLSRPTYAWETNGRINEGPVALVDGGNAVIVYSASGSWTDDYCLGKLTLTGEDPLDAKSWTKDTKAAFSKVKGTYGPGHCSFVEALDGQLWMVYHANTESGKGWSGRTCRAQPVIWDGKTLDLGTPVPAGGSVLVPYGTYIIKNEVK